MSERNEILMQKCLYISPGLRKHDVCFLITVRPTKPYGTKFDRRRPFIEQVGLVYVRGCEIQGMLDDKGRVIEDGMVFHIMGGKCMLKEWYISLPFFPFYFLGGQFSYCIY